MIEFERVFGVPEGHSLRRAGVPPRGERGDSPRGDPGDGGPGPWEHEEYDAAGRLVAVYESRRGPDGALAYVKYSPHGWVLSLSGRSPRLPGRPPPRRPPHPRPAGAA